LWSDLLPLIMMKKIKGPIKPTQFAEKYILNAIINNTWSAGDKLPPERELAEQIGITRPTLREVLQRLSRDGWLKITHGKSTIVNDYKANGGLGILKTLVGHDDSVYSHLISNWLEFRTLILPQLAQNAVNENAEAILDKLKKIPEVTANNKIFATYDWELQLLLIKNSGNIIARMLYNDLTGIYHKEAAKYFRSHYSKMKSLTYYNALKNSIIKNNNIIDIVRNNMEESKKIWQNQQENTN